MIQSGIEIAAFRLVAQYLNKLPHLSCYELNYFAFMHLFLFVPFVSHCFQNVLQDRITRSKFVQLIGT